MHAAAHKVGRDGGHEQWLIVNDGAHGHNAAAQFVAQPIGHLAQGLGVARLDLNRQHLEAVHRHRGGLLAAAAGYTTFIALRPLGNTNEGERVILDADVDLAAVAQMSADEAIATLTARRGVGRWTAEYMLMRAFGNPDALPAGDVSLQLLIGTALLGKRATEAELRQATAHWSPWRGWAAFHVWANRQFGG